MYKTNRFKYFLLFLGIVFLLFMSFAFGLLPGQAGGQALAASNTGWQQQNSGTSANLKSISAVNKNIAWAAGNGIILKTTDGGTTWTKNLEPSGILLNKVCAIDQDNVWAVGSGGTILRTANGGTNWVAQTSGTGNELFDIAAINGSIAWAVGSGGTILKTIDGGDHWISQVSGATNKLGSVCVFNADTAWVTGWSLLYAPTFNMPYPPFLDAPYRPILLQTADGGSTWQASQLGTYNEYLSDIASLGNSAIAVGHDVAYSPIPGLYFVVDQPAYLYLQVSAVYPVLVTNDAGQIWSTPVTNAQVFLSAVDMADVQTAWAVGATGIFKTLDGGNSWVGQQSSVVYAVNGIDALDPSTAWAVGDNGSIQKTTTGGNAEQPAPVVTSVAPVEAGQFAFAVDISVQGTGFSPFATLKLDKAGSLIYASSINVVSDTKITGTIILFGAEPGAYDVVVTNPDAQQGRLSGGFNVTSACGAGSGAGMLMLGLSLGLLSLVGAGQRIRHNRKAGS